MNKIIGLTLTVGILISSCNVPTGESADTQIATAAALTVQAAVNGAALASPTGSSGSVEATPTYSQPIVSVDDVTNCRTGPGVNYERVAQIFPTDPVEIVGFFPPNYWIVSTKFGECWISGEFTTPSGSFAGVPTVAAPATPQGGAPENVSLQKWDISCDFQTNAANITIRWVDKEEESGYRVVRNDIIIAELPADSTEFLETITLLAGQTVGYSVIAFNAIGSTTSKTISLSC